MRVLILSGSGLSADSGLPTFRGAGGLYRGMAAEAFLSADGYARDPDAVEAWLDALRTAVSAAEPNRAHAALTAYQARQPDVVLCTQNVDTLLERAGARAVVHLHGRLDRLRCVGHAHPLALGALGGEAGAVTRAGVPARCPRCGSRLRSDVVLFGEAAPEYRTLRAWLRRAGPADALVVIGTQGTVLPVADMARAFPGRRLLNNLHPSAAIDDAAFDRVLRAPAADAADDVIATLERWRGERGHRRAGPRAAGRDAATSREAAPDRPGDAGPPHAGKSAHAG